MRTPKLGRRSQSCSIEEIKTYDVAVIGDYGVGKSSLIEKLISGSFSNDHQPTVAEVHMYTVKDEQDKKLAFLKLYDTAGGFEFPTMLKLTITKCQAYLIVYSITSLRSLEIARRQLDEISKVKGKHFPAVLVANKCDAVENNSCNINDKKYCEVTDTSNNPGIIIKRQAKDSEEKSDVKFKKEFYITNEITGEKTCGIKNDDGQRQVTYEQGIQTAVQYGCSYIEISVKENKNITETFRTMVRKIEYTTTVQRRLLAECHATLQRTDSDKRLFRSTSLDTGN